MRSPRSELPDITAEIAERLRQRRPRVHCITNPVAQAFTANVLLAAGAIPSMTVSPKEVVPFVRRCDALLVNLGMFDVERQKAALAAIPVANKKRHALGARSGLHRLIGAARGIRQAPGREEADRAAAEPARARRARRQRQGSGRVHAPCRQNEHCDRADRRARLRVGRHTACHHRERRSADGEGDRDGLRRLGAGRRLSRGRGRSPGLPPRRRWSCSASPARSRRRAHAGPAASRWRSSTRCTVSTASR